MGNVRDGDAVRIPHVFQVAVGNVGEGARQGGVALVFQGACGQVVGGWRPANEGGWPEAVHKLSMGTGSYGISMPLQP